MPSAGVENRYVGDEEPLKTSMFMRVRNFSERCGFTVRISHGRNRRRLGEAFNRKVRKEKPRRSQRKSVKVAEEEVSEFLVLGSRLWF
jgi:hypothetical protein